MVVLYPTDSSGMEVTPTCPDAPTYCNGGNNYGIQQYIYQGHVILPPCRDWIISYYLCCRNFSNTLVNPESSGMYIPATLDNLDAPCSSSPSFSNIPITIMCEGQTFCFNHGVIDPDGDSLVYSLVTPYDKGPGTSSPKVIFDHGYSAKQPFPSDPPITLNSQTGEICMSPTQLIISPMALLVQKFRKGINIGSVLRDMQVNVTLCNNQLPSLSGIDSASSQYDTLHNAFSDTICLGNTVKFTIYGHGPDNNNISIKWNKAIAGANFTVINNLSPDVSAKFSWKPKAANLRDAPYCFTATVSDDVCPYIGSQTYSYCIVVKGFNLYLGNDTTICKGSDYLLSAHTSNNNVSYKWTLDNRLLSLPSNASTYLIKTDTLALGTHIIGLTVSDNRANICEASNVVKITIANNPLVNLPKLINICQGKDTTLDAGASGKRFLWNTGDTTRSIIVNTSGEYFVLADGGYGTSCIVRDTVRVNVTPMPQPINLGEDTCIAEANPQFTLDAGKNTSNFKYFWSNGETTQNINITLSGKYIVTVTSNPSSQCFKSDTIIVNLLTRHFLGTDTTICHLTPITFNAPSPPSGWSYTLKWEPSGITTPQLSLSGHDIGETKIYLQIYGGCKDTLVVNVKACDLIIPDVFAPHSTLNNKFEIKNIDSYSSSRISIFNRWGENVFENNKYENRDNWWDGNNSPPGVYFYILNIQGMKPIHGSITILK